MRTAMAGPAPKRTSAHEKGSTGSPLLRRASFSRATRADVSANSSSSHVVSAPSHSGSSASSSTAFIPTSNSMTFARCEPFSARTTSVGATAVKRRSISASASPWKLSSSSTMLSFSSGWIDAGMAVPFVDRGRARPRGGSVSAALSPRPQAAERVDGERDATVALPSPAGKPSSEARSRQPL